MFNTVIIMSTEIMMVIMLIMFVGWRQFHQLLIIMIMKALTEVLNPRGYATLVLFALRTTLIRMNEHAFI